MGYPAKLLTSGETIVYDLRPHWRVLFYPAVALIAIVFVVVLVISNIPSGWTWALWAVAAIAAFLFVLWVVAPVIRWATSQYVFTNKRVIVRTGIVARQGRDMPLQRINDVHFHYGVIDRMLGCGDLIVESAGETGQMHIRAVPDVELIQREVFRLHEEDDTLRRHQGD
ncbi:MAG TPA: PH domain-containing protein [Actinomycetes bacterium]|nr:PH domain-containing protein [Actinomycetes bacterium]